MLDRLFAPVLAFMMLFGGTAMFMSGLFPAERTATPDEAAAIAALYSHSPDAAPSGMSLERVEITVPRADALRQVEEEDLRLRQQRTSTAPRATEGRGVMLHAERE